MRRTTHILRHKNRRLENGERARTLVAWLNSLPEVQAVLAAEFAGQPINEKNLSQWCKYGCKQWLWHQQALAMTQEMTSPLNPPVPDQMAGWVMARHLFAIRQLVETSTGGEPDVKTLRAFLFYKASGLPEVLRAWHHPQANRSFWQRSWLWPRGGGRVGWWLRWV